MQLLDEIDVEVKDEVKYIRLYHGDLTDLPDNDPVDILFISAIPGLYDPIPGSMIYALDKKGVKVKELAKNKKHDYRKEFSCWMSQDIDSIQPGIQFKNIVVFEPNIENYKPTEIVSDLFRAIIPFTSGEAVKIATPLLSTRSMLWGEAEMLTLLIETALAWMSNGLQLQELKIVIFNEDQIKEIYTQFTILKQRFYFEQKNKQKEISEPNKSYDIFISYSHKNSSEANIIYQSLKELNHSLRIFIDKLELQPGLSWQQEIFKALEKSSKILALLSPQYLESKVCIEEFDIALLRNRESSTQILYPLLITKTQLPYYMRSIQYLTLLPKEINEIQELKSKLGSIIKKEGIRELDTLSVGNDIAKNTNTFTQQDLNNSIDKLKRVYGKSIPLERICDKNNWALNEVLNQLEDLIIESKINGKLIPQENGKYFLELS